MRRERVASILPLAVSLIGLTPLLGDRATDDIRDQRYRHPTEVPDRRSRRRLASVQHRVPGRLPGQHELPRLPDAGRRGPLRGGLHPRPRPEPGRGDLRLRLLRALREGLPPRGHRQAARDPRHEALPGRLALRQQHARQRRRRAAQRQERGRHRRRAGRTGRRQGARQLRARGPRLRGAPVRRRHDPHRRAGLPAAARRDRARRELGRQARRASSTTTSRSAATSPSTSCAIGTTRSSSRPAACTRSP